MSSRHQARTLCLQTLFELDCKEELSFGVASEKGVLALLRNRDDHLPELKDTHFAEELLGSICSRLVTLDDIIVRAAPDWPLEKISLIDRNILRMGLCELLFGQRNDTPPKVAIDEAIELAKEFGGETSSKFVNGVLGAIYKEMGEPEKGQNSKNKAAKKKEYLVGSVVYAKAKEGLKFALVHDVFGYWTLTKGKLEAEALPEDEKLFIEAEKKILAEIGISAKVTKKIGENEYIANKPEIGKVIRHVAYVVGESEDTPLHLAEKGGLDKADWFTFEEASALKMYPDILPLLTKIFEENL